MRIFAASNRYAPALVAAAAALPRLVIVVVERGSILSAYTEKSDYFAQTFVASGTFGFAPGIPSADTQPLYGYFLIPIYWILGRNWWSVGIAQTLVATATALLVFAIARRVAPRLAVAAAVVATLNPYLVWHDVHVNREITDQLVLAALVLCVLVASERRSLWLWVLAGALSGVAILGNTRLAAFPVVLALYALWRKPPQRPLVFVAILAAAAVVVSPWLIRNKVEVGCLTLTTDGRALWKANNVNTYGVLARGGWIDDVPPLPGAPKYTPEYEWDFYHLDHRIVHVDECGQMTLYENATFTFWRKHPGEKAKLMAQAVSLLWDPRVHETQGRSGKGTWLDTMRRVGEPIYIVPIYALAAVGLFFASADFSVLAVLLLINTTVAAMLFAGTTRYRTPYDFLLVLLAAATVQGLWERRARRSRYTPETPSTAAPSEN